MLAINSNLFSLKDFLNSFKIDINILSKIKFIVVFYLFFYPYFLWTIKRIYRSIEKINRENYKEKIDGLSPVLRIKSYELRIKREDIKMLAINETKKGLLFDFDFNLNSIIDNLKDRYYKIKAIKKLNEIIYILETIKDVLEIEDISSFRKENLENLLKKEISIITTLEKFLKRDFINSNSLLKIKLEKIYKLSKSLYNLTLEKLEDMEDLEDIIKSRSEDKKSIPLEEFLEMDL